MFEHHFQCPYCWESISMLLDSSQGYQKYIEDCEVCCNPIELEINFEAAVLERFSAASREQ